MATETNFVPLALTYRETRKPDLTNSVTFFYNELYVVPSDIDGDAILNGEYRNVKYLRDRKNERATALFVAEWATLPLYLREGEVRLYTQTHHPRIFRFYDLNEFTQKLHPPHHALYPLHHPLNTLHRALLALSKQSEPVKRDLMDSTVTINGLFHGAPVKEGTLPSGRVCRVVCAADLR